MKVKSIRVGILSLVAACAVAVAGIAVQEAGAAKPERVFRGQIITSKKRLPTRAKSARAFIKKLRKAKTKKFWENKEKKEWKIYYAAFFRKPLNDLEVTVKLYDITDGRRHMVSSFEQYVSERGQRSLISHVTLERKYFGVNRHIMMTFETRGKILAMTKFRILGKAEKHSGEVDFTDDE